MPNKADRDRRRYAESKFSDIKLTAGFGTYPTEGPPTASGTACQKGATAASTVTKDTFISVVRTLRRPTVTISFLH